MSAEYDQYTLEVMVPILNDSNAHSSVKQAIHARQGVARVNRVTNGGHRYMHYVTDPIHAEEIEDAAEQLRAYLTDMYPDREVSKVQGPEGPFANTEYPRYEINVSHR